MRFWSREIIGWLLVLLGIAAFGLAIGWLTRWGAYLDGDSSSVPPVVEAGIVSVIGIVVFRGGIHLLKVALAARVCLSARNREATMKDER